MDRRLGLVRPNQSDNSALIAEQALEFGRLFSRDESPIRRRENSGREFRRAERWFAIHLVIGRDIGAKRDFTFYRGAARGELSEQQQSRH